MHVSEEKGSLGNPCVEKGEKGDLMQVVEDRRGRESQRAKVTIVRGTYGYVVKRGYRTGVSQEPGSDELGRFARPPTEPDSRSQAS